MGMGWMWLFWLLLIIGAVLLAVVTARALGGGVARGDGGEGGVPREQSRARQVLDERYARGEISTEEYAERLRVLGGGAYCGRSPGAGRSSWVAWDCSAPRSAAPAWCSEAGRG